MANSSAGTIAQFIWNILRTQGGSTDLPALQESFILTLISQAQGEYHRAFRRNGAEQLQSVLEAGFDLIADTLLNEVSGITTTDTEFTVDDSDDFDVSAGALALWKGVTPDVIYYDTNTVATETFSGASQIGMTHDDNEICQKLYKLPTNFKTFRPADGYGDGVYLNGELHFRDAPPAPGYFTMRDDGTNKFLWLPRGASGDASVLFERTSTVIDSTDDLVDVPEDYEFFLVWRPVQIACIPKGTSSELYLIAKAEANKILQEALDDRPISKYARVRKFEPLGRRYYDASLFQKVPR